MDREIYYMNRVELINIMAEIAKLTKAEATRALDAFQDAVKKSLKRGDPLVLVNFCTLTVKTRAAREGRNPLTGEKIKIKAGRVVGFKAGKALKEAVKEDN